MEPCAPVACRSFFAAMISVLAFVAPDARPQSQEASPAGVSVRLELKEGKADFLMGEPIILKLTLWAEQPGYLADVTNIFGVSEQIDVTPSEGAFQWHGWNATDVITLEPLTATGRSQSLLLNDGVIIKAPGTYSVSVTTRRVAQGTRTDFSSLKWLTLTSNPVVIHVAPMSEDEEAKRVAELSKIIAQTDHSDGLDHPAEVHLACLVGDIAARKKVELYLTGRDDITGIRKTGLALSRNKELELTLLDEAWRSVKRVPDQYLLEQMLILRQLDAGIAVQGFRPVSAGLTKEEAARELADRTQYVSEILATMSHRRGTNKSATREFLDQEKKEEDSLLSDAN